MIFGKFTDAVLSGHADGWARPLPTSRVSEGRTYPIQRHRFAAHEGHFRAQNMREVLGSELLQDGWEIESTNAARLHQVFDIKLDAPCSECRR